MRHARAFAGEVVPKAPSPWMLEPAQVWAGINDQIPCDTLVVGLIQPQRPRPDELLATHGLSAEQVLRWTQTGHSQDAFVKAALRHGTAVAKPEDDQGSDLIKGQHGLALTLAEPGATRRVWLLVLGRRQGEFTADQQQLAALILRRWQVGFARAEEPDMGHVLVGHDDRLILADLGTQARLLKQPDLLTQLLTALKPIVAQRWPQLPEHTSRDAAVMLDHEPLWICFRRGQVAPVPEAEYWYLELRPLQPGELTVAGTVEDPRIAQALAYLHENYQKAPSLAQVARHVHVSPFHFHRLFSRQVGASPKQYLLRKQLQAAKWMLRATRMPVGMIAQRTGFASHGHFTSTFRRFVGASPSEYREQAY